MACEEFMQFRKSQVGLSTTQFILGTLLLSLIFPFQIQAQVGTGNQVLILAPREYQRRLTLAQKAIDAAEYADAIEILNLVLAGGTERADGQQTEDFFIGEVKSGHFGDSIRSKAERLLLTMPKEAIEVYELQFGAEAKALLKKGIVDRDVPLLQEVRRRFFVTQAGQMANVLIGKHYLDTGKPLAASRCFTDERIERASSAALKQEMLLLQGTSLYLAGKKQLAKKSIERLQSEFPDYSFDLGGKKHALAQVKDVDKWLASVFGDIDLSKKNSPIHWAVVRGDPQRNAESSGSFPLLKLRWRLPITDDPAYADAIEQAKRDRNEARQNLVPSLQPLVVGQHVYFRGARQMVAVNLQTGKRVWAFPWAEIERENEFGNAFSSSNSKTGRVAEMKTRIWDNSIYTQMSSDGEAVFLVDQLPSTNIGGNDFDRIFWDRVPQSSTANVLVALEMATEGKYLWRVGNRDGEDEPALAGAYFLGPPLVIQDDLYVIAVRNNDITLFVLHRKTGKLKWSQQLAHLERRFNTGRHLKTAGAVPSYSDGILICPTSVGAVVAVDVASRSLLWGNQYKTSTVRNGRRQPFFEDNFGGIDQSKNQRWLDSTVLISNGNVIVAPPDRDELMNFDLLTGKSKWSDRVEREKHLYVAGVYRGIVTLVGPQTVEALDLETGKRIWRLGRLSESNTDAYVTGRGFRTGDHYFLPTSDAILKINLLDGKLVKSVRCNEPLHNLVAYKDQIVSLGPQWLTAFFQIEKLEDIVNERLQQDANDLWALEQQGLLMINAGQIDAGRAQIEKAFNSYPANHPDRDGTRQNLIDVMIDLLNADFKKYESLIPKLDRLIDRRTDRNRYWIALGRGYLEFGKPDLAFDAYLNSAFASPSISFAFDRTELEQISKDRAVLPERSIQAGIYQSVLKANEQQKASMSKKIQQITADAIRADDIHLMTKCVRLLANLPEVDALRVKLAQHFFGIENLLIAEQYLLSTIKSADPKIAATSYLLLAKIYGKAGYNQAAGNCIRMVAKRWPEVELNGEPVDYLAKMLARPQAIRQFVESKRWDYGAVLVQAQDASALAGGRETLFRSSNFREMLAADQMDQVTPKLNLYLDQNAIVATDDFGIEHFRANSQLQTFGNQSLAVSANRIGGLLVLNYGELISVFNVLDKPPLESAFHSPIWPNKQSVIMRQQSRGRSLSSRTMKWGQRMKYLRGGKITGLGPISPSGLVYLEGAKLVCVDPQTGEKNWVRTDLKAGSEVWGDEELVFVASRGGYEARVFDFIDGREFGKRPIPTSDKIWKKVGRHILSVRDEQFEGKPVSTLSLFDTWTENKRWVKRVRRRFKGYADDRGMLAILEPPADEESLDGNLHIFDLQTGDSLVKTELEFPGERAIIELTSSNHQILLTCVKSKVKIDNQEYMDGLIYAFDRSSGKMQWQRPLEFRGQAMHIAVPRELPILFFHRRDGRSSNSFATRSGRRGRTMDFACVDKRDGRLLFQGRQSITREGFSIQGDMSNNEVRIRMPDSKVRGLTFTDQPRPPAPVATVKPKGAGVARALLQGLFQGP